jgi:hypothetical protein
LDTEGCIEKVGIIATRMLYYVRHDPEFGEHTPTNPMIPNNSGPRKCRASTNVVPVRNSWTET